MKKLSKKINIHTISMYSLCMCSCHIECDDLYDNHVLLHDGWILPPK
ncbi:hypothetical protein [Abyssisolibacter fermentans]|nr:hypothetical protein [Abyssisolibacter fermentans]